MPIEPCVNPPRPFPEELRAMRVSCLFPVTRRFSGLPGPEPNEFTVIYRHRQRTKLLRLEKNFHFQTKSAVGPSASMMGPRVTTQIKVTTPHS